MMIHKYSIEVHWDVPVKLKTRVESHGGKGRLSQSVEPSQFVLTGKQGVVYIHILLRTAFNG